jgi:hypothetical protein
MRIPLSLIILSTTLATSGCVLSVGHQPDGSVIAAHWIDLQANRKLAQAIRSNLEGDPVTHGAGLSVKVEDSNAYLGGATNKPEILARAVTLALETPGVESVRCEVTVIK